jgi:hypothetical protein
MSARNRLATAGLSATAVAAIQGTTANSLTATGSTQGTALALPADICRVTSTPAGTGVIIAPSNSGDSGQVINADGTQALLLYPPVGGKINALSTNAGYSIAAATPMCDWTCIDPLTFTATQGA